MPHKASPSPTRGRQCNIVDIANWLVDNVTPAHSPALAQDYSALLSALENMASGAIVKRGQDKYKEGEEPSHAPDPASLKSSIGRDEGNYDYLGILEKESNEAEERHRALLEQKRGEREGRRLVAEVMQAVKAALLWQMPSVSTHHRSHRNCGLAGLPLLLSLCPIPCRSSTER